MKDAIKGRVFLCALYATSVLLLGITVAMPSWSQTANTTLSADRIAKMAASDRARFNAMPAPADDPLMDSSGHPVMDSNGNPESDPNEGFHRVSVTPHDFDPAKTFLVEAAWLDGIGCPTGASVATYPSTTPTGTFTDSACAAGDPKDKKNEGLLLLKSGPTSNNASAVAELKKVRGVTLHELGYDIKKIGVPGLDSPQGSHCGAGAPRFDIVTTDDSYFVGCRSPVPNSQTTASPGSGDAWDRLRWGTSGVVMGFSYTSFLLVAITGTVQRIAIVFDEGTDTGMDYFGTAILDNIEVNGTIVGHSIDED
jgi:hypothetical protein